MSGAAFSGAAGAFPRLYPTAAALPGPEPERAGSVAVVMRTRNRPLLLPRALSSVLCQTYRHWHLYLVNDGGDRQVLESLLPSYESALAGRVTVIHHETSRGMENASNACLERAREEFAVVHDDDDSWHPEFLDATTAFLSDPAHSRFVGVTTGCMHVTERVGADGIEELGSTVWPHHRELVDFAAHLAGNTFPPISLLFRRAAVDVTGPFNGALQVLGDWEFNIRLMMLGDIDFIDRNLASYHYRVPGSGADYGNTVVEGVDRHRRQHTLLRNSMLRAAIAADPAALGIVQSTMFALKKPDEPDRQPDAGRDALTVADLAGIEASLAIIRREVRGLAAAIEATPRPAHWLGRKMQALRRWAKDRP